MDMKKRFLSLLLAMAAVFTLIAVPAYAAAVTDGCKASVVFESINVTKTASPFGAVDMLEKGDTLTVLEAYINGEGNKTENYHKVQLQNGTVGYVYAYANGQDTLEAIGSTESGNTSGTVSGTSTGASTGTTSGTAASASDKYQHGIDMNFLKDYIYGGSKATDGEKVVGAYAEVPNEWTRHKRPSSLPLVGMAVLHIGDEGKEGSVRASFYPPGYPGSPSGNYHSQRLDELAAIGYQPFNSDYSRSNANWAFFLSVTSELEVVAYDENWVAVWSDGGVDTSRGLYSPCSGVKYIPYTSWKPGVYFFPRKYCYILDINNQLSEAPSSAAMGKATGLLKIKTTPDAADYVQAGVYKLNQSFQIVDAAPVNGHYKVYYKHGIYYVDANYVNVKLNNVQKPVTVYTAQTADAINIYSAADTNSAVVAKAQKGATLDIPDSDISSAFTKVWFNTKECYVETAKLTNHQKTSSGAGIAQLGSPIGVLVIDSPWSAYGAAAYSEDAYRLFKASNYGYSADAGEMYTALVETSGAMAILNENEWANVYKIEDFSCVPDSDNPEYVENGKVYTIVYGGEIRYIVQPESSNAAFTYYPGNGYSKTTVANNQAVGVDGTGYTALAYNIDGNNYFKLRDIAMMMDKTAKNFDVKYDAATNSIDILSYFDYTSAGGELTPGDGETRTAYSSSAFLTYDGVPVAANCYNIDGNNYFKLRDVTDALDCRVEWDGDNQLININSMVPAYDDPSEPVG